MKKINRALLVLGIFFIMIPCAFSESTNVDSDIASQDFTVDTSKRIAFVSKRNGNADIFTINDAGSDLKQLTYGKEDDIMPQWSPDGGKILYISIKNGKHTIWIVNSDGSDPKQLAEDCDKPYQPLWSPDNTKVAFVFQNKIFVRNMDDNDAICLTEPGTQAISPSWSPDGTKLLYTRSQNNELYLCLVNSDGTGQTRLVPQSGSYLSPSWAPDGKKIAYIDTSGFLFFAKSEIFTVNPNGTDKLNIVKGDALVWSPDSSLLALMKVARQEVTMSNGKAYPKSIYGLFFIKADGNGFEKKIVETGEQQCVPYWAPDSSKIAYILDNRLYVYSLKTDKTIRIKVPTLISQPKWSSNSLQIVCAAKAGLFKKSSIFIASVDGSSIRKITSETADDDPVWRPGAI